MSNVSLWWATAFLLIALISTTIALYRFMRLSLRLFRAIGEAMQEQNNFNGSVIESLRMLEKKGK